MKNRYLKFSTLIILVFFCLTTIMPAAALAGPGENPNYRRGRDGHGPGKNHKPGRGHDTVFKHVPPGSQKVRHRGDNYYSHRGRFYRHGPKGYFWVRPPIGIISYSLPAAAITVLIGGLTYYVYDSVYYRRVPAGYQVVQVPTQTTTIVHTPPAVPMDPADSGTQAVVTAKILNVRSGPGSNHGVLTQTYMGNVLIIQGSASDWYYVRLPDNTYGWVMKAFVTITGNGAQG
ncbi:SH3 domain-containing protein [Desulfobacter hydrogenophilus]|uniref:SH3 domain-containing protein n=1 Tax=Desulfobacter hydrogenophilus TaxID=2291 RepID=A0A328FCZ9_9BACT|nr:SH3 domain-containing protein [Desulfobacter hydrogenophilus]NDY71492.1 SH3 domain-containing protein [Desulfobacter hydrogenophilus]QBH11877.1 SH3 domain-containing protein [Desulfobacter hydrogenophilus]RAM02521.1 SH3 domain-containing protein [Desulfobacter hydrogenophilus]